MQLPGRGTRVRELTRLLVCGGLRDAGSVASLSMQGSLTSNGRCAVSHLSGYPAAVGVGSFAIQLRLVNMALPYVLTGSFDWNSRLLMASEGDSVPGKLS